MVKLSVILLLILFAISGCGNSKNKLSPDNPVTLTMWHVYGNSTRSPLNNLIDKFNATEGKKNGVAIRVISVSTSSKIDRVLLSSIANEPGSVPLPDLFTAYPRIINNIDTKLLLNWKDYLSPEDLSSYQPIFIQEGTYNNELLMLPIAKSTDILFVNRAYFEDFAAATGHTAADLNDFSRIFAMCSDYYRWSDGKRFFQMDDIYNYFLINMFSLGDNFIKDGKPDLYSSNFISIYTPMARAAIEGGMSVYNGYASNHWKTGNLICYTGSSASILYQRDYIIKNNNTKEPMDVLYLGYPLFHKYQGRHALIYRGAGLFAMKSEEERKNLGAAVFAKWIGEKENNLEFVTKAGYLPVNKTAFKELSQTDRENLNPRYRKLYNAISNDNNDVYYTTYPLYKTTMLTQANIENYTRRILTACHKEYLRRLNQGEDKETILTELTAKSLRKLQMKMQKKVG